MVKKKNTDFAGQIVIKFLGGDENFAYTCTCEVISQILYSFKSMNKEIQII